MGLIINIAGLESEESVTTFRLLVSEEALRSAEIREDRAESNIIKFESPDKKQRKYH